MMKFLIARMSHESNTFSPVPTTWERFADKAGNFGEAAIQTYQGTKTPIGAYIDLAREVGAEIVLPIAASASPSGPVASETYDFMSNSILEAVRHGCDAILLDLHGAMVAETTADGEGTLLRRIRAVAPEVPICVTCDLHANLTQDMVNNCDALIGYKTYPHIDMYDVGYQISRVLLDQLAGKVNPVMAWGNRPLLPHTLCMGHEFEPMKTLQGMTRDAERKGVLAASVFGGFPLADIETAGLSAVVVADDDRELARAAVDSLLDAAWERCEDFVYQGEPLDEAIARAKQLGDGPIVLLDHADNCASGGTQDVMMVIAEILRQELEDVAVAAVWDPEAVQEMAKAGIGTTITLALGGKSDMPSLGLKGMPLEVTGKVRQLSDGEFIVSGPMGTGQMVRMGPTALLDTGKVEIVVISRQTEPWDVGVFTSVGIDPSTKRYLLLKSRLHWRAAFGSLARHVVMCDGEGVTTSDYSRFDFRHLRRPIFPLDDVSWP
jgi:microcystin degradation protein MlrC